MGWLADYSIAKLQRRPVWVRLIVGLARSLAPIVTVGRTVFVLGAREVREVLARSHDFEIGQANRNKMLMGEFLLGMDPAWQRYHNYRSELGAVLLELDSRYDAVLGHACNQTMSAVPQTGRIDLVQSFAEPVVAALIEHFYGLLPPAGSGVIETESPTMRLVYLLRCVGSIIAMTSPAPFGRQRIAEDAAAELCDHLTRLIETRRAAIVAGDAVQPTVLDCLVRNELNRQTTSAEAAAVDKAAKLDSESTSSGETAEFRTPIVRAKLAGLVLAGSTALVKAFAHAMNELLEGRMGGTGSVPLSLAVAAAGNRTAQGQEQLTRIVLEALRYNPTFPQVPRYCPKSTTLAPDSLHGGEVAAGANVVPVLISAMFDEGAVPQAETFGPQRPPDAYFHFGYGDHECLGKSVATRTLVAMAQHFLERPGSERGRSHGLRYDGVAVESFVVDLPGKPQTGAGK